MTMKDQAAIKLWSAIPTPLTPSLIVDQASVARLVCDAIESGLDGLFIAGTCGEGPWLPDSERLRLIKAVVKEGRGRLRIAVQVTDNSVPRIIDQAKQAADAGADYVIMAAPPVFLNSTTDRIAGLFMKVADRSPLPLGIYDLGMRRAAAIPESRLIEVYSHPRVAFVKDSSGSPERRDLALAARAQRDSLQLLNGDEFSFVDYLEAGYDGIMFGGAVAVMPQIREGAARYFAGDFAGARAVETEMRYLLHGIYGGNDISCWLTGLKHYLVCRGIFSDSASFLDYPLSNECRAFGAALASGRLPVGTVTAER